MINSPPPPETAEPHSADINTIVRAGPSGAVALAGLATVIVLLMWLAFYVFVFVPRATAL